MTKTFRILLLSLSLVPVATTSAFAQDSLNAFLDKVLEASQRPSCEETHKALSQIPESDIQAASNEIKTLNNQAVLNTFKEKISKINQLTSRCPDVQDSFVKQLSRFDLKASIDARSVTMNTTVSFERIREFVAYASSALQTDSCQSAAQKMSQLPRITCDNVIQAFQTLDPNTLVDAQYREIAGMLQTIMSKSSSCPDFQQAYKTCLTPGTTRYRASSELQPLLDWLLAIQKAFQSTSCDKIDSIIIDETLEKRVQTTYINIRPSEYSPTDIAKLKSAIRDAREAGKSCPRAKDFLQNRIDRLFAP